MAKMESTVVIARPVAEVFGFFLALDETAPKVDPASGRSLRRRLGRRGLERPSGSVSRASGR